MKRSIFLTGLASAFAASAGPVRAETFRQRVLNQIHDIPGDAGIYARTMGYGPPIFAYNANASFPSASTIKVAIMLTAFRIADGTPGVMNDVITFHRRELIGGSDFLAQASDGERFSVHDLLVPMIQVSDNTAANLLMSYFGMSTINSAIAHAGMTNTYLRRHFLDFSAIVHHMDNRTTPADMGHLLYEIERGSREGIATVASPESCRRMIRIMLGQTDRDTIPKLLPHGVRVANKTGELSRSRSDIAIVEPFGESPYVIAVYTNHLGGPAQAYEPIARISRLIYGQVAGTGM